jgi:hypothetical protein
MMVPVVVARRDHERQAYRPDAPGVKFTGFDAFESADLRSLTP